MWRVKRLYQRQNARGATTWSDQAGWDSEAIAQERDNESYHWVVIAKVQKRTQMKRCLRNNMTSLRQSNSRVYSLSPWVSCDAILVRSETQELQNWKGQFCTCWIPTKKCLVCSWIYRSRTLWRSLGWVCTETSWSREESCDRRWGRSAPPGSCHLTYNSHFPTTL